MKNIFLCALLILTFLLNNTSAEAKETTQQLQKVKLQLKWLHQFEFAGYYAAIEKGFYKEAGLDVELILPDGNTDPIDIVNENKADFGIAGSNILLARSENKKVVVVSSIFQHSPFILLVDKNTGITQSRQLKNKKIALEPDSSEIVAVLHQANVFPRPENIVPLKYDAVQLLSKEADAISSYITDEPYLLDSIGYKYQIISPLAEGIDFYGDVLFTSENLLKTQPEMVEKFRQASIKGWHYSLDHPHEIIFLIINKYSRRHSMNHLLFEMEKMKMLIQEDLVEIGYSNPRRWEKILSEYKKQGKIDANFSLKGLLYSPPVPVQTFNFPWKPFAILVLILGAISFLTYIFYKTSRRLKREIENREIIQKRLIESEALYRSILYASPDTIILTDLNGNIQYVSPAGINTFGFDIGDVMGKSMFDFIDSNYQEKAQTLYAKIFNGYPLGTQEYKGIKADRSLIDIEVNEDVIYDDEKKPLSIIFVVRDVTEKKITEEKLRNNEKRFRQIVEQIQTVIWEVNTQGLYTYVSPMSSQSWGYSPEELIGKLHLYELHPSETREKFKMDISEIIQKAQSFKDFENKIVKPDGSIVWVTSNGSPILDENKKLIGYRGSDSEITYLKDAEEVIRKLNTGLEEKIKERTAQLLEINESLTNEIDERKRIEKELVVAKNEAEKANKAKSEFLSRMSHELRTPMNAILGFAQLLEMGELNASQRKGLNHILKSGRHLLDLINEVLDISRIEAGKLSLSIEPIEINHVISEMIDVIRPQTLNKRLEIVLKTDELTNCYIQADRQRLKQTLLNLLDNACKYNNADGKITITTKRNTDSKTGKVFIHLEVTDTGSGITEEDLRKLFIPFERIGADNTNIEGTGLGLSVVKRLVDAMNGKYGVESIINEGSKFWIAFEECESPSKVAESSLLNQQNQLSNKKGTILYIEDNYSNIELVEQILFMYRPNVQLITDRKGSNAVNLAQEHNPSLIFLDLDLPDIHGTEVIQQLLGNKTTKHIPVVVISADAMPNQIKRLKELGAKNYLTKPIDVQILLTITDEIITPQNY